MSLGARLSRRAKQARRKRRQVNFAAKAPGRERNDPEIIPIYRTPQERRINEIQQWMDENLPPAGTPEWEALCNGCGKCCYDKMWEGDRLLLLTSACAHLDLEKNRCRVYPDRFEKEPMCMPIGAEIIEMGGLPEDCPYVENFPGYRGPKAVDKRLDEM